MAPPVEILPLAERTVKNLRKLDHSLKNDLWPFGAQPIRYSSVRFVAGELDPMATREAFLIAAQQVNDPIMVLYGAETPPKSRAEMEALAGLPNVVATVVPHAKLAVHEEFPDEVATTIMRFLRAA